MAFKLTALASRLFRRPSRAQKSGASATRSDRHLLVDVSVIIRHDAKTGIQRVVRAIWHHLHDRPINGVTVYPVFATAKQRYCYAARDAHGAPCMPPKTILRPVEVQAGDVFLGLDLSAHLLFRHRGQILSWKKRGLHLSLVVYDLLPITKPEWFSQRTHRHFQRWLQILARHADSVICISEDTAREVSAWLERFGKPRDRSIAIRRMPLGADLASTMPSKGTPPALTDIVDQMQRRPTILMVGTVEPRKGYDAALDALEYLWQRLPDQAPNLIVVGKAGWKTEALQRRMTEHFADGARFRWLQNVSDEFLEMLYANAALVLVASRGEGFGLPVVEALGHGRHVLARDLPVLRELARPGLSFFQSDDPAILAQDLMAALASNQSPVSQTGLPTWSDSAHAVLEAIDLVPIAASGLSDEMGEDSCLSP
jgi:glycosyltransferase involved in cell wall biosynthesis